MTIIRDRLLLTVAGFVRATTTSVIGISLGVHLGGLGLSAGSLGLIVSSGLFGAALAAAVATLFGDHFGRRRFLIALSLLGALGAATFALSTSPIALAIAAFVGMLNGMGKDRGAGLILEQAALPSTTDDQGRTAAIAVYTMFQDLGHALGAALVGSASWLASIHPTRASSLDYPTVFLACGAASLVSVFVYAAMGPMIDAARPTGRLRLSSDSRRILTRISTLFAIDSLAGGFLTSALLSYFFFERFGASTASIGALFFGARLMNALSHLGAAWLAKRIGLVNTMVFTHIPSSVLLMTVAFAPSFEVAAALFLLREGLVEMDVPTRQSYVFALVRPEERTFASGVTNLVRVGAWAVAPGFAGMLMGSDTMYLPLVIAGSMKIAYDLLLWRAFRRLRPPEEEPAR